jgi:membrane protein
VPNSWNTLTERLLGRIWHDDLRDMPRPRRMLMHLLRLLYVTLRDLMGGQLSLRAMSLVYTTLLSLVPLIAVSFSVLKGFGVHNQVEPILFNFLAPLGPKGAEVGEQIISFVDNMKAGVLGSIGLAFLLYTVISLIQKIEESFNFVWQVERLRSFSQRFSNYLSVILVGPILMFTALGITASVMSLEVVQQLMATEPFGRIFAMAARFMPYLLVCIAFTFIYVFIPNTRVKVGAAVAGAVIGGILWQSTGWAFASFVASSARYAAIYSGFAILILLLIWMYLSWVILLLGAQVAFYVQNPQYLVREQVRLTLSSRLKERLGLDLMYLIARSHHRNEPPWTLAALTDHLRIPGEPVQQLLGILVNTGYLAETADEPPAYLPCRDIATITVADLLAGIAQAGEGPFLKEGDLPPVSVVDRTVTRAREARDLALGEQTLKDLVLEAKPARDPA